MSQICFRFVLDLFQICFKSVLDLSWICHRFVLELLYIYICLRIVLDLSQICFRFVLDLFQICVRFVSILFQTWFRFVLDLLQICNDQHANLQHTCLRYLSKGWRIHRVTRNSKEFTREYTTEERRDRRQHRPGNIVKDRLDTRRSERRQDHDFSTLESHTNDYEFHQYNDHFDQRCNCPGIAMTNTNFSINRNLNPDRVNVE